MSDMGRKRTYADVKRCLSISAPIPTPDGRYLVIEGKAGPRLWRTANPNLLTEQRVELVHGLMEGRRAVRVARNDPDTLRQARAQVDLAKRRLGERGPVWWSDGTPDLNRRLINNTPYFGWWANRTR